MSYINTLNQVLSVFSDEVFPGQKNEIRAMTFAHGCDICEHVPTLIKYAMQVKSITEMGVRFGWSTRSFLFARPKSLLSIDKFEWNSIHQSGAVWAPGNSEFKKYSQLYSNYVNHKFILSDTTKLSPIDSTELLFIDTFHHRDCLKQELELHGNSATKFLIMHDTETFGKRGQADSSKTFVDFVATDEEGTGLWDAIKPFMQANPHWKLKEHYPNNNGLTILERK